MRNDPGTPRTYVRLVLYPYHPIPALLSEAYFVSGAPVALSALYRRPLNL